MSQVRVKDWLVLYFRLPLGTAGLLQNLHVSNNVMCGVENPSQGDRYTMTAQYRHSGRCGRFLSKCVVASEDRHCRECVRFLSGHSKCTVIDMYECDRCIWLWWICMWWLQETDIVESVPDFSPTMQCTVVDMYHYDRYLCGDHRWQTLWWVCQVSLLLCKMYCDRYVWLW